tara:strand:- start:5205 stop:6188 length:984 start_codon:yes stop_codon:yes gene_type:complete
MDSVYDIITAYLPAKRKTTPSGWTSFNAPCCVHNGDSADTRQRGGLITNADGGVSYHCFNCGFKASWQKGRNLSHKLRKLLQWLGTPDDVINKLALQVMAEAENVFVNKKILDIPTFNTVPLPEDAVKITDITEFNKYSIAVLEYMSSRSLNLDDTDYYWSPSLGYRDRLIIPFYYEKRIVGWTARTVTANKNPKYMSEQQPGFVYGLDEQGPNKVFTIVCEGPVDAIHIEGVALLGSEIKDQQALLINRLSKDVIVVPDRDDAGSKLVEQAIELGWHVSMPDWNDNINDIGDAVDMYGRLYTLHSIAVSSESSPLKIRLRAKKWFG